jgi:hypothetical protein
MALLARSTRCFHTILTIINILTIRFQPGASLTRPGSSSPGLRPRATREITREIVESAVKTAGWKWRQTSPLHKTSLLYYYSTILLYYCTTTPTRRSSRSWLTMTPYLCEGIAPSPTLRACRRVRWGARAQSGAAGRHGGLDASRCPTAALSLHMCARPTTGHPRREGTSQSNQTHTGASRSNTGTALSASGVPTHRRQTESRVGRRKGIRRSRCVGVTSVVRMCARARSMCPVPVPGDLLQDYRCTSGEARLRC